MRNFNKKPIAIFALILCMSFVLCGCETMTQLSDDDYERVVVYVTGVISKFNRNQNRGVVPVNMKKIREEEAAQALADGTGQESADVGPIDIIDPTVDGTLTDAEGNPVEGDTPADGTVSGPPPAATGVTSSLTDIVAIPGVTFTYKTVGVNNNYGSTDFFVYEPTPGNSFVTAIFTVQNTTGSEVDCNLQGQSLSFTASVGGQTAVVYRTAFGDDLTTFNKKLAPGEKKDLTILFQFPEATAANLSDFQLTVIKDGVRHPVTL